MGEDTRVDAEIAQGASVKVLYDGALTRSIPAQANALAVVALAAPAPAAEDGATVTANE